MVQTLLALSCLSVLASAHTVAWTKGMYCFGGANPNVDEDTNTAVNPLYDMTKQDWWFQHYSGCDAAPPKQGVFLNLTPNKTFTVELAHNRGQTTLSKSGTGYSDWPDGKSHPEDWSGTIT